MTEEWAKFWRASLGWLFFVFGLGGFIVLVGLARLLTQNLGCST